ncbi:GTP-binding protein HSR1 [candidate division KSB1 bacterium]|nr:MAG: GTP-binding protein HSR1 [candidate division KSB1 bacterium]
MPANLTPQYLEAEQRYREAQTLQEKLSALKEMLATIPKHKGTEKLQADIKRRIARLKDELEKKKKQKRGFTLYVEREGAGQVTLVGGPNVGKSQLLTAVTHATPEVADYPFTTRVPQPGMMTYQDVQIQLVDLPPICAEYMESWVPGLIRNADAVLLLFDLSASDPLEQIENVREQLYQRKIKLIAQSPAESQSLSIAHKRTLLVGNKIDLPEAMENMKIVNELYSRTFPFLAISAKTGEGLEMLKEMVFRLLNIVRVYSKPPGHKAEFDRPFILKKGSNLLDFAKAVHKDFAEKLKFARVWGAEKFDGQRINRDYILMDGDVIELHI